MPALSIPLRGGRFKRAFALAAVMAAVSPALAGERDPWALPTPPAERGKPMIVTPPAPPPPDAAYCLPGLPCGTRLYGAVERNGAVEVTIPALRW